MSNEERIPMDSVNAIDPNLDVQLTITPEEAKARVNKVILSLAAKDPEILKQLLQGVKDAQAAKMSASQIVSLLEGTLGKAVDILI